MSYTACFNKSLNKYISRAIGSSNLIAPIETKFDDKEAAAGDGCRPRIYYYYRILRWPYRLGLMRLSGAYLIV
jgi:hypothetical protein